MRKYDEFDTLLRMSPDATGHAGNSYTTVDEYFARYDGEVRERLEKLRALIRACSPEITEKISYGIATFVLNGNLVHVAGEKKHIGFHPTPSAIEAFSDRLLPYKTSKGTVQFPHDKPVPYELVREMVEFRIVEQVEKGKKKS